MTVPYLEMHVGNSYAEILLDCDDPEAMLGAHRGLGVPVLALLDVSVLSG